MKITVLRGIPGSGKSTYAIGIRNAEVEFGLTPVIVSADLYFMSGLEYRFDISKLGDAHRWCLREFIQNINDKMSHIFVDNTNINLEDIAPYVAVGEALGYDVEVIQINADPVAAALRNVHGVPLNSVRSMAERLERIKLPSRWNVKLLNPNWL